MITLLFPVVERPEEAGRDAFGVLWGYESGAEGGTYPLPGEPVITDIEKWKEQLIVPNIETANWGEIARAAKKVNREEHILEGYCEMGIFERVCLLLGMEEALIAFHTHPEDVYDLCEAIADYKIALIRKFYDVTKFDMLKYGDDWGTQLNLFVSPQIWRDIIKPGTKRIYDCAKELGLLINQHSCGKIESIFADLCEMGADIWNPCQPCNDLKGLKISYGDKICFAGGVDSQFVLANPSKTPADVKEEVKKRINEMALPNGGYITMPSHGVPYDEEKLAAMEATATEYGHAVYGNITG